MLKKNTYLTIAIISLLIGCGLPPQKKLTKETRNELESIKRQLQAENIQYGYIKKTSNGIENLYFRISVYDIPNKLKPELPKFNLLLINSFKKSGYNFDKCTISFFYSEKYQDAKLLKYYKTDPSGNILHEADK